MRRMPTLKVTLIATFLSLAITGLAQQRDPETFYVESWKRGHQQIQEQKLTIELNSSEPEYQAVIKDSLGSEQYKLVVYHFPVERIPYYEFWRISLYRKLKLCTASDRSQNWDLLTLEGGPPGDNLPKENNIGLLYPAEKPNILKDNGMAVYPISAKRVIKVEGFYVIIQVIGYKFNSTNPRAVDSLTVQVEFTNKYEGAGEVREDKRPSVKVKANPK